MKRSLLILSLILLAGLAFGQEYDKSAQFEITGGVFGAQYNGTYASSWVTQVGGVFRMKHDSPLRIVGGGSMNTIYNSEEFAPERHLGIHFGFATDLEDPREESMSNLLFGILFNYFEEPGGTAQAGLSALGKVYWDISDSFGFVGTANIGYGTAFFPFFQVGGGVYYRIVQ